MGNPFHMIRQIFGTTVAGPGAVVQQGFFQKWDLPESLIPEFVTELQTRFPTPTDARNPDCIFRSVAQLGFLNEKERVTLTGPDARPVLDNIENVLQALSQPTDSHRIFDKEATKEYDTNQRNSRQSALASIKRSLCASEHVNVNQPHSIRREISHRPTCTVLSRVEDKFDIAHAQVRVYTWKRRLLPSRAGNSTCDEFTVRIDVQPKLQGAPDGSPYISIYFQQIREVGRCSFVDPMIVARRTVPNSSPVFQMIKDGDFGGFMRLLQNGQASLWDCDSRGCSLINYANYHLRPDICKYLIENGADVDCIEPEPYANGNSLMPLLILNDPGRNKSSHLFLKIARNLLEAGADPTLGNPLSLLFMTLVADIWPFQKQIADLILKFGHEYVDAKAYDSKGQTILLTHCFTLSYNSEAVVEGIDALIKLGSTVDECDRWGNTCLHHILPYSISDVWDWFGLFIVIYHLLALGADANARTSLGETPSDMVCFRKEMALCKIWDLALHVKGIKVDDWEAKKQNLHKRNGTGLRVPPLPERDGRISERDWLECVWSEAEGWVYAGSDWAEDDWLECYGLEAEVEEVEEEEVQEKAEEVEETELDETESNEEELTPNQPSSTSYTLWDFWS